MILFFVSRALRARSSRLFWFGRRTIVGCSLPMFIDEGALTWGVLVGERN